jgi:O-antigen/teichoic acid export membrane protein/glycosyltransferase involved in cell wall biosynthesis
MSLISRGLGLRRIYTNAVFLTVADAATKGAGGLLALILARWLGPASYGEYAVAASICAMWMMLTVIGFDEEFTRRSGKDPSQTTNTLSMNLTAVSFMAVLAYGGMLLVARQPRFSPTIYSLVVLMGLATTISRFHVTFRNLCLVLQRSKVTAALQSISTGGLLLVSIGLLNSGAGVRAIAWAQVGAALFGLGLWVLWLRKQSISLSFQGGRLIGFFKGAMPFAASNILWVAYFNFDTFLMSLLRSVEEVGVYAGVYKLMGVAYILGYSVANTFTPLLFQRAHGDRKEFRKVSDQLLASMGALGLLVSLGLFTYSGPIVTAVIGKTYSDGILIAKILSASVMLRMLNFGLCEVLTTGGRQSARIFSEVCALATNIILNYTLISRFGGAGAAAATVGSEMMLFLCAGGWAWRSGFLFKGRENKKAEGSPIRICLDLRYKTESGASSYIRNLVPQIFQLDRKNSYILVKYPGQKFDFENRAEKVILAPQGADWVHMIWTLLVLPFKLMRHKVDVYHGLKMPGPFFNPAGTVRTMHSISGSYKGEFPVSWKARLFDMFYGQPTIARAEKFIAVSDYVRDYLVDKHRISADKIRVVYHGIDNGFGVMGESAIRPLLRRYSLPANYVLCVGNVVPVKNHITAVRAFSEALRGVESHLVIAGAMQDPYYHKVTREIEALGLSSRVSMLGFIQNRELSALMNGAIALLFPSLTEGCPVTMLEAFKCGLPVIASKRGGLWDLGKDCALFVDDPKDHRGFAAHLANILSSPALREELRIKSLGRAAEFSWRRAGEDHVKTYRTLQEIHAGEGRLPVPAL